MKGTRRGSGKKLREAVVQDAELYTVTCAWKPCSKEFPMTPSVSGINTEHYCSGTCAWVAMKAKAAQREQVVDAGFPPVTEAERVVMGDDDEQEEEDAMIERPSVTVPCPFKIEEGAACGGSLTLEVEPEDRSVGLAETITNVDGECPHAALAAAEMETRDWKDAPGPLEQALYGALERYYYAQIKQYESPTEDPT